MSQFSNSHNSSYFSLLYCGDLCSLIFRVTIAIVLVHHESSLHKMLNLVNVCVDCSTDQPSPLFLPFLGPSYSLRTTILNPIVGRKEGRERKSCMSVTLNQKPEVSKHIEAHISKTTAGKKLVLLNQQVS